MQLAEINHDPILDFNFMITLQREKSPKDRTLGHVNLPDGTLISTLERPWLDNQRSISCIPAGIYKFKLDTHGRFQWFRLLDVPGRSNIEIHLGSKPEHSEGCILMSRPDIKSLLWWFNDEQLTYILEIKDYEHMG